MSSKSKEELLQLLLTDVTPALEQFISNDLYGDVVIAIRERTLFLQPRVDANVSNIKRVMAEKPENDDEAYSGFQGADANFVNFAPRKIRLALADASQ